MFKRRWSILSFGLLASAVLASGAVGAPVPHRSRPPVKPLGVISQLPGPNGCLVDRSSRRRGCTSVRALVGPGPFVGSEAIAVSPDGRNVYAASSSSNAIAVFRRAPSTGKLTQAPGPAGCIAAGGRDGAGAAWDLPVQTPWRSARTGRTSTQPRSRAARSPPSSATRPPARSPSEQMAPAASPPWRSPAARSPERSTEPTSWRSATTAATSTSAHSEAARSPCSPARRPARSRNSSATAVASRREEPTVARSGARCPRPRASPSAATAQRVRGGAGQQRVDVLARDTSTGALTQPTDGSGCFVNSPLSGCTVGRQLGGADAVAVSSDDRSVYVAASLTNSVANFTRTPSTGLLAQSSGTTGCAIYVLAVACTLGGTLTVPEGLAISPDGANVYAASFLPGSIDVFDRTVSTAALMEKPRRPGCVSRRSSSCAHASPTRGASSAVAQPRRQERLRHGLRKQCGRRVQTT